MEECKLLLKCIPVDNKTKRMLVQEEMDSDLERDIEEVGEILADLARTPTPIAPVTEVIVGYMSMDDLPQVTYKQLHQVVGSLRAGAIIMQDPYEQYLSELPPGEKAKILVARESQALKAVFPLINGRGHAEALLDSGSQIVSMSLGMADKLGLSWDPDVIINMQSANKQVERTKGLARNVPFVFDTLTVHLQVHIMTNPAYDVLLGKPFECLTQSNVQTWKNGGVELTLTDPNTGQKLVVPTYDKGKTPQLLTREPVQPGFQDSMS